MTERLDRAALLLRGEMVQAPVADIVAAPAIADERPYCRDRNFGLPPALTLSVFGFFFLYLAVMWVGFAADGLVMPMVINFLFVAAFAIVPGLWSRIGPRHDDHALPWGEFRRLGIDTATGITGAGEATTLVLLLPASILFWGIATTTIAALV